MLSVSKVGCTPPSAASPVPVSIAESVVLESTPGVPPSDSGEPPSEEVVVDELQPTDAPTETTATIN
jgi:hypothetical protein